MFTVNNKDTITTAIVLVSSFLILNSSTPYSCASVANFAWDRWDYWDLLGRIISQTKPFRIKSILPFCFTITKICVTILLAENGTRMGGI